MNRVRLGLIGMGLIGMPHAQTLQRVEECDLVPVADVDQKYREPAEKLGAKYTKTIGKQPNKRIERTRKTRRSS